MRGHVFEPFHFQRFLNRYNQNQKAGKCVSTYLDHYIKSSQYYMLIGQLQKRLLTRFASQNHPFDM